MIDLFNKPFSYFMATIVTYIVPMVIVFILLESTIGDSIHSKAIKFVDACRVQGEIRPEEYSAFSQYVYKQGEYEITLTHSSIKAYPNGNDVSDYYGDYTTSEILEYMYPENSDNKAYPMKNGDLLTINVVRTQENGFITAIKNMLHIPVKNTIMVNYGAEVQNNAS